MPEALKRGKQRNYKLLSVFHLKIPICQCLYSFVQDYQKKYIKYIMSASHTPWEFEMTHIHTQISMPQFNVLADTLITRSNNQQENGDTLSMLNFDRFSLLMHLYQHNYKIIRDSQLEIRMSMRYGNDKAMPLVWLYHPASWKAKLILILHVCFFRT